VSAAVSAARLQSRQATLPFIRDRIEEADQQFFARAAQGFEAVAAAEPQRVRVLDADGTMDEVGARVWELVQPILPRR
ncbi:MAG: dTMP kinase, partial [Verrucomicrobia bacterium]|nr:dTMP kinase [Verrucomicrobiota bacterium]